MSNKVPSNKELEARACAENWLYATQRLGAATAALMAAAQHHFDEGQSATALVKEFEAAEDAVKEADRSLRTGKLPIGKKPKSAEDDPIEQQRMHFVRIQANREDQSLSEADIRSRQQAAERAQIEAETAAAAAELDKAGAPGVPAGPGDLTQRRSQLFPPRDADDAAGEPVGEKEPVAPAAGCK